MNTPNGIVNCHCGKPASAWMNGTSQCFCDEHTPFRDGRIDDLRTRLAASEQARERAEADVQFYKDRERYFANALHVADGGQYRADWDAAIEDMIKRCARAEARLAAAEKVVEAARAFWKEETDAQLHALSHAFAEYDAVRAGGAG